MITVDKYKAFHGVMRIESKLKRVPVVEIEGDWLYKPHTNTWHCNGISYPAKFCVVVSDDSEKQTPIKPYYFSDGYADGFPVYDEARCPICECDFEEESTNWGCKYCPDCGQALDWSV